MEEEKGEDSSPGSQRWGSSCDGTNSELIGGPGLYAETAGTVLYQRPEYGNELCPAPQERVTLSREAGTLCLTPGPWILCHGGYM